LSFIGILYAIILRLFFPEITVSGFTLTIISIFFIGGVQMIMLGIIGSYIGKIYLEVKNRPLYIIDSIISNE
jgi:dolichol-phosphate mannosyltransferase